MEFPKERNRILMPTLAIAGAFALSGCGEDSAEPPFTVNVEYNEDGSRLTTIDGDDGEFPDVYDYCDGPDLVSVTGLNTTEGYSGVGNSIDRSVDHPACDDGVLTEEDFVNR